MDSLTRKARVSRPQGPRAPCITTNSLHIIVEEVEPSSCTSSVSSGGRKAKRRHCNLSESDIQIARDFVGLGDEEQLSNCEDRLMLVPPQSAKLAPTPSADSFRVNISESESLTFPRPPASKPSSLEFNSEDISTLLTNLEDDDILRLPTPKFNPRRSGIYSLTTLKPCASTHPSPITSEEESSDSDSDSESDSEWYLNELSKVLTISTPSAAPAQKARPDSIFIAPPPNRSSPSSFQLEPLCPKKRRSKQFHLPTCPLPLPAIPVHLRNVSHLVPSAPVSPPSPFASFSAECSPIRPPPRSSVPTDLDESDFDDDSSVFSFGVQHSNDKGAAVLDEAEFHIDLDYPMMLPLSLPGTPIDLEADFVSGLQELRLRSATAIAFPSPLAPVREQSEETVCPYAFPPAARSATYPRSPIRDSWASFYVSQPPSAAIPITCPLSAQASACIQSPVEECFTVNGEMAALKSKWSSSTLGSIREEHESIRSSKIGIFSSKKHQRISSKVSGKSPTSPKLSSPISSKKQSTQQKAQAAVSRAMAGVTRHKRQTSETSDAGSDGGSKTHGLRRKPIPLELFLRH